MLAPKPESRIKFEAGFAVRFWLAWGIALSPPIFHLP